VVLGVVLLLNPFYSLAVLLLGVVAGLALAGIGELVDDEPSAAPRWARRALGIVLLVGAVLVAWWPGLTLGALAVALGVGLVVEGVLRGLGGIRGTTDQRVTAVISGLASVVLGVLAIAWPDVTVFVLAVIVGIRLVTYGVARLRIALRGRERGQERVTEPARRASGVRRFARTLAATGALALAMVLLLVSSFLHRSEPRPDAFYSPPASVPAEPGRLIRAEPFSRGMPPDSHAWRILYTTTRADGSAAVASGLVVVRADVPAGPRPVIAWAHGTTGYAIGCAPTVLEDPLGSGAMPALDQVMSMGWVLVATDYVGLGTEGPHPYLIGPGEAHSVLDAVRAARQLGQVELSERTVVWGHSQGGHAALWTGQLQPDYAPDVPLAGVVALSPASDLTGLVAGLDDVTGGALFASFVIQAYADTYADVRFADYIRPAAHVQVREMATRCLHEPEVFVSIVQSLLFGQSILAEDPATGALGRRLAENTPTGPIEAPVLIGQGAEDPLVSADLQTAYVADRCAEGSSIDYRIVPGDHLTVLDDDSPLVATLMAWTQARLDGEPVAAGCPPS